MSDYTLVTGDCLDTMREMQPESVDAVVTDPPYGTEGLVGGYGRRQLYGGTGRNIAGDADLSALEAALPLIARVLRSDAWVAAFCAPRKRPQVDRLFEAAGFKHFGEVVWDKKQPGLGYSIRYQHETAVVWQRGEPEKRDEPVLSVLRAPSGLRARAAEMHPHTKPVPVLRELVRWCCPPDGLVLDPFMGTGSTGVAAREEGRRFVGVEVDEEYARAAAERLREARLSLFAESEAA